MQAFINFIQQEYIFLIINGLIFIILYILAYALGKNSAKNRTEAPAKNMDKVSPEQQAAAAKKLADSSEQLRQLLADFAQQLKTQQPQAALERRNLLTHFLPTVFCREVGRQLHGLDEAGQELWLNNALAALQVLNAERVNLWLKTAAIKLTINELSGLVAIAKKFGKRAEIENFIQS